MATTGGELAAHAQDAPLPAGALRTLDIGGLPTRVLDAGTGPPVVLIHGGDFGSLYAIETWSLTIAALARDHRVLAFDKLGQGRTANPETDADYTFERVLAHAVGTIAALEPGPVHLVGHSMGALVALRIGLDRPEHVRSVTIVDSNTVAPDDPRFPWNAFYEDLRQRMPPDAPSRASVRLEVEAQAYDPRWITDAFVDELLVIARLPKMVDAEQRMQRLRHAVWMPSIRRARAAALAALAETGLLVPLLVAWGQEDRSAPVPLAHALFEVAAARSRQAELLVLGRAAHYAFRDRPDAFVRAVRAFCAAAG